MNTNEIYMRRRNKVILSEGTGKVDLTYIATLMKNLENLGYTLSPALVERLSTLDETRLEKFYTSTVTVLKQMVGAHREFSPMYPNFPTQVMEASEAELYVNAIMHYLGDVFGMRIMPEYEKAERMPLADNIKLKVIDLGTEEDFLTIGRAIIGAKSSISETDKADMSWFVKKYKKDRNAIASLIPTEVTHKENLTYLTSLLLTEAPEMATEVIKLYNSATDVLRLATALSDGDVSLATNTKFKNFSRPQRKLMMAIIDGMKNATEDMLRYKNRWIRLGERIHPNEYKGRYDNAVKAFHDIRNNVKVTTFAGKVEEALASGDLTASLKLLKTRGGEMARRLDHLFRIANTRSQQNSVVTEFSKVAEKVATPVLLQVMAHFKHRNDENDLRVIFPKGNVAKAIALDNELPLLNEKVCEDLVSICETNLKTRFAELDSMGKVYIGEEIDNHLVPFSQRSASKALRTTVRGSRMKMPEGNTIRFFTWWKDIGGGYNGRVDIDLSAVMYDNDWKYKEHISYTNLRSTTYKAAHSGDITSAPNGACEFIDIDIDSFVEYGGRYVVMNVLSFTNQPFTDMPECFAGWMMRQKPKSGEIFDPKTVQDKFDITADTRITIPVILDLVEREVIWADVALKSNPNYHVNVEGNKKGIAIMGKALTSLKKPTLGELFALHVEARGERVETVEEADLVISMDGDITPFDAETIMADYL